MIHIQIKNNLYDLYMDLVCLNLSYFQVNFCFRSCFRSFRVYSVLRLIVEVGRSARDGAKSAVRQDACLCDPPERSISKCRRHP